jgi:polyisoprenoid-binding protein YceI
MNTNKSKKRVAILLLLALGLITTAIYGQERYTQTSSSNVTVSGTSTIHDWHMTSSGVTCTAEFDANASGEVVKLNALQVVLPAESLKSGKSGMDKNAYSALMTEKHKQIAFQLVSAKIEAGVIQCQGKLKIAGVTKDVSLKATYTTLPGRVLQVKGSINLVMTDFGVQPPTFMFGSVTTGDAITVTFDVALAPAKNIPVTLN